MEALPNEILLAILKYIDIRSLFKLSCVNKNLHECVADPYLWLSLCRDVPLVKAFIAATNLEAQLISGTINPRSFLLNFLNGNCNELEFLMSDCKQIELWFPVYEQGGAKLQKFFKPINNNKRLFLTKEIAQSCTLNKESVIDFCTITVPIINIDLSSLINLGLTHYSAAEKSPVPTQPSHKRKVI